MLPSVLNNKDEALLPSQESDADYVIEVSGAINSNAAFYRISLAAPPTSVAVDRIPSDYVRQGFILALTLNDGSNGFGEVTGYMIVFDLYMMNHCIPSDRIESCVLLNMQATENLQDVEEQMCFLLHALKGATNCYQLPLLRESFSVDMESYCSSGRSQR
ncbi:uncharacterized protein LOC110711159 isoform X2 [Chenopodium quinoa]|nr:uncharacterized protein LOC110711159 isoform X2 [Chenopodium quinoa]